ncbi:MAG: ATP-binding cassette domain-containing protein, partial [Gammaproteobacteria bacterium]|nr:ATP-binding cassette domain-containing protein [Gammaproteobacteria bacterium]
MGLVDVEKLTFTYENEGLYKSVSFSLQFGEHACLVGKNGSGKSTFMKLLADKLTPDSGTITWLNGIKYSYLDQQLEVKTDISIRDYLYGVYKELFDREERLNNLYLEASLEDGETQEELFNKAEELRLSLEMDNFYQIEPEINNCIVGLGLANIDLSRRLKELSGGEKAKVYLCKILLEKP